MSDWADKLAQAVHRAGMTPRDIAAALRQARIEALEEAARVADGNALEAWDFGANETRGLMRLQADDIAASIRALKDKQP